MLKFSILIPVIKGKFLAIAIESVLKQTFSDWEMIIYNDCSPDNIDEIIAQYNDNRIKYFKSDKNLGNEDPSKTWNKILKHAKGQYICLLGDDDYLSTNYLEEIQKLILKYPNSNVFRTGLRRVDEKNVVFFSEEPVPEYESWDQAFYQRNVKNRSQSTSEFVLKKSALDNIGGYINFPRACGSDDATYFLLARENGIVATNSTFGYWRKSNLNISDNDTQEMNEYKIKFFLEWERDFLDSFFPLQTSAHTLYKSVDNRLLESDVRKQREESIRIQSEINDIRSSEQHAHSKIKALEEELRIKQQEVIDLDLQIKTETQQFKKELHISSEQIIIGQKHITDLNVQLEVVQQFKNHLQAQVEWLQNEFNISKQRIEELNQHTGRVETELTFVKNQFSVAESELELTKTQLTSIQTELDSTKTQFNFTQEELNSTTVQLLSTQTELANVYLSREWKLIGILRKIVKIFIPKGSIRRKIVGICWEAIKAPVRLILRISKKIENKKLSSILNTEPSVSIENKQINNNLKKIVYIGHSYHNKTKSTVFLIDYLKEFYDVTVVLDDSWKGGEFSDLSFIDENYFGVVFFQNLPKSEILKNIKNDNIIFFPMYDNVGSFGYSFWKDYKHIKIINFSKTLHNRLISWGLNSIHVKYFPEPNEFIPGYKNEVFFWQRLTKININIFSKLFLEEKLKIHIHKAIDPYENFVQPSVEDEKKFSITYSDWFERRDDMINLIKQKGLYIAPREFEGIGMSFLEAMAMGKAVVAVNNPTMNEYIEHSKTGYLFNIEKPEQINLSNINEVQKNTYEFMKQGYKKWENDKYQIINFINGEKELEKQPLVSIITVTFNLIKNNRKSFFYQCLESIHNQTYKNTEHIVIDGASNDGTIDLIKEYVNKGWIKYISEPDTGVYDAMNKGIKLAQGKYIVFLNSDDYFHNYDAIKLSIKELEESGADFSYAPANMVDIDGKNLPFNHPYSSPNISNMFFQMAFCHQTMFTKREVMIKEGMFNTNFKNAGDYDFLIRICLKNYRCVFVDKNLVTFRYNGLSILNREQSINEVMESYFENYNKLVPITREECIKIHCDTPSNIPLKLAEKLKNYNPYFDYNEYLNKLNGVEINKTDTKLDLARKDKQILIIQLFKIGGFHDFYMRSKWAALNPFKFIKKYLIKSLPDSSKIKWVLFHPILFFKKYIFKKSKNFIKNELFIQNNYIQDLSPQTQRVYVYLKTMIKSKKNI